MKGEAGRLSIHFHITYISSSEPLVSARLPPRPPALCIQSTSPIIITRPAILHYSLDPYGRCIIEAQQHGPGDRTITLHRLAGDGLVATSPPPSRPQRDVHSGGALVDVGVVNLLAVEHSVARFPASEHRRRVAPEVTAVLKVATAVGVAALPTRMPATSRSRCAAARCCLDERVHTQKTGPLS